MTKILAIDDRVDNLTTVSALLRAMIPGCTVITAQTGAEGIQKALSEMPDTILLDIRMPGMDGFEVCRRLKADPVVRAIPVIMLTAIDTNSESRIKGLNLGADAFLSKPVDPGELAAQVKVMLRIKQAEDDLIRQRDELNGLVDQRTRELRTTEEHYRTLFNSTNDAIFIQSLDGRFWEVNDEACNRLGYARGELLEMGPAELEAANLAALPQSRLDELIRHGKAIYTMALTTRAGRTILSEIGCKLIEHHGKPYVMCVARDITERLRAEEEKMKLEAQLLQAQKMEAIGTLAGGIAHDFNNILSAIMGYTELAIANLSKDCRVLENLKNVFEAGKRARDLVQQILTFSRQGDAGTRPVQVHLIVKEAIRLLRASLPSTITIRQNVKVDSGAVAADPTQIHQVVMNLCTNAYHALKDKGGILEISLNRMRVDETFTPSRPNLKTGEYVRLVVSDTGHGMDATTLERIFDPFFTTKERGEGTGMGLSVVHGIVSSCGGTIEVSSIPGQGSTFVVYFPRTDKDAPHVAELPDPPLMGTERILMVDDEPILTEMNEQLLGRLGYKVTATTSSLDALNIFTAHPNRFDLVLTDLTMPHMTGIQLSQKILQIRKDIPVILCTGFSESVTHDMVKAVGIRELLLKPVIQKDLARAIRKVLGEGQAGVKSGQ